MKTILLPVKKFEVKKRKIFFDWQKKAVSQQMLRCYSYVLQPTQPFMLNVNNYPKKTAKRLTFDKRVLGFRFEENTIKAVFQVVNSITYYTPGTCLQ